MAEEYNVTWSPEDIQSLKPEWSLEKCKTFLDEYFSDMSDRMVEVGWEVVEVFVNEFGDDDEEE